MVKEGSERDPVAQDRTFDLLSPFTVHSFRLTVHRSPFTLSASPSAVRRPPFTLPLASPSTVRRPPFTSPLASPSAVRRSPNMTLLIDIGNTRLKWAELRDGVLSAQCAFAHSCADRARLIEEMQASVARPERVLIANVGGADIGAA